jgi:hypothetical protein
MTINISVDLPDNKAEQKGSFEDVSIKLNARKSIDGNVMIFDHIDIDIVMMPEKKKIVAFPKETMSDIVYGAQNRMFDFLIKKGIILPETVQGGNVYGALEGIFPESKSADTTNIVLLSLSKFMDEERPYFAYDKAYQQQEIDRLVDPEDEEYTELGEVPHSAQKGSITRDTHGRYTPGYR